LSAALRNYVSVDTAGDRWDKIIRDQIDTCAAFVVIMTPDADESDWVNREINRAEQQRKPVFPLLLKGSTFFRLSNLQFEDVTGGRLPSDRYITRLQQATGLGTTATRQQPTAPPPIRATASVPRIAGPIVAWGANENGQVNVPPGITDAIAVAAGGSHSLALHRDGRVTAWGRNKLGQVSVPAGTTDAIAIAAGDSHSLALHRDGHVTAWGDNGSGQVTVPVWITDAIAAGGSHSLALHRDGRVTGWGDNGFGQVTVPAGIRDAIAIAAGGYNSLFQNRSGHSLAGLPATSRG
jgi:hypothetical protein